MAKEASQDLLKRLIHPIASAPEVAETLGVSKATIYYWIDGRMRPAEKYRKKLEKIYNIPASGWDR